MRLIWTRAAFTSTRNEYGASTIFMTITASLNDKPKPIERAAALLFLCLMLALQAIAQVPVSANAPLPQDTGTAGLKQMLLRLNTTARLLHTTAHPDDEDGGMLVLESRGKGDDVVLLTLNRGEGGQNKIGSTLFDVLGVVRTLELLAADRYYGVEQRFTRVADFGFSKSADETFQKWGGHDVALRDMVRVIRTLRPDVIVSRFQGNDRDGHGHHQACGILTREAFRAAADPNRFPEQIKEGLQPWQAKKLYVDNVRPFGQTAPPNPDDYTLELDTGAVDPALGMSYVQFAMQGLKYQLSQGAGAWNVPSGPHVSYYKLADSVLPPLPAGAHEKDFFDGIDTTVVGLATQLGDEERKVPFLRLGLQDLQSYVNQARALADSDPRKAAEPLLAGFNAAKHLIGEIESSTLSTGAKSELVTELETKRDQFEKASNLALGMKMTAIVDGPPPTREGFMAVRGGSFTLTVNVAKPSPEVKVPTIQIDVPRGWSAKRITPVSATNDVVTARFMVTVAPDAPYTRLCEHRKSILEPVFEVDNDACATLPLPAPIARAVADYSVGRSSTLEFRSGQDTYDVQTHIGEISAPVEVRFIQDNRATGIRPLAVGPKFSVGVDPLMQIFRIGQNAPLPVRVTGNMNLLPPVNAAFRLSAPDGWKITQTGMPDSLFLKPGDMRAAEYGLTPPAGASESRTDVQASMTHDDGAYREGYTLVTRPDIGSALYYQPAVEHVSGVDVKLPEGLKVGYIMGAGDDIPSVLRQLGMDVTVISPQDMAAGDLSKYGTIVLGIRVYDTRDDVRANNKRLLDYVANGGTLVVQYNANTQELNAGHYAPYPAELSHERVTVEEAPVEILAPNDGVFHFPNNIAQRDFDGWVQERGLYFMGKWDEHYQPLLSSHDPGEQPLNGGLLRASYGKGTYIYTGYAFFRQLPFGVPGAVRLFVNIVSAGHERK
jgi:LmbE family N-acetylglucosaminyl deacetylase